MAQRDQRLSKHQTSPKTHIPKYTNLNLAHSPPTPCHTRYSHGNTCRASAAPAALDYLVLRRPRTGGRRLGLDLQPAISTTPPPRPRATLRRRRLRFSLSTPQLLALRARRSLESTPAPTSPRSTTSTRTATRCSAPTTSTRSRAALLALLGAGRVVDEECVKRKRVGKDVVPHVVAADRNAVKVQRRRVGRLVAHRHLDRLEVRVHLGVDGCVLAQGLKAKVAGHGEGRAWMGQRSCALRVVPLGEMPGVRDSWTAQLDW